MTQDQITRSRIDAIARLIRPYVRVTPVLEVRGSDFGLGVDRLFFKLELYQHAGSFKPRGAFANMLSRQIPPAGVVAASGGNHGIAVAYAAHTLGVRARIFVPSVASPVKMAKIRGYGAELEVAGDRYADALAASQDWIRRTGALEIHAYDSVETLLGQATLGLELEQQVPDVETVLIAVGGGGLIGGVAAYFGERNGSRRVSVVGVEPETAPTLACAMKAGRPVESPAGGIAADSLAPRQVGALMFPIAQRHVQRTVLVPDAAIRDAQEMLWDRIRVVTEPGGAAAFAALLSGAYAPRAAERVVVILCGANTTAVDFRR
jgi:threonine dehydratase